jgi:hypothetical protein
MIGIKECQHHAVAGRLVGGIALSKRCVPRYIRSAPALRDSGTGMSPLVPDDWKQSMLARARDAGLARFWSIGHANVPTSSLRLMDEGARPSSFKVIAYSNIAPERYSGYLRACTNASRPRLTLQS